ncbi:unnamed protein product, partial [Meganyctiphanes norvegica]
AVQETEKMMKNCSGFLMPEVKDGNPSVALFFIGTSECQIEINTYKNAKYYANGTLKPVYNLQTKVSVQFDMYYNEDKRCLEASFIWVGERPSNDCLSLTSNQHCLPVFRKLRYNNQFYEENEKRKRIQQQDRQQFIYRMKMDRLNQNLKRYKNKISINDNNLMYSIKLTRRKKWHKNRIMKKKHKLRIFNLKLKNKNVNDRNKSKKQTSERGIKPFMNISYSFINSSNHINSSSNKCKTETNELNTEFFKCVHQNLIYSKKKKSIPTKGKRCKQKKLQWPAGPACLLFNSQKSKLQTIDQYQSFNLQTDSSSDVEFWSNKKNMFVDKKILENIEQKEYKHLFQITEKFKLVNKNSSVIKQLIWTRSQVGMTEESSASWLPGPVVNLQRILAENISYRNRKSVTLPQQHQLSKSTFRNDKHCQVLTKDQTEYIS